MNKMSFDGVRNRIFAFACISVEIGEKFPVTNRNVKPMILDFKQRAFVSPRLALLTLGASAALLLLLACIDFMKWWSEQRCL